MKKVLIVLGSLVGLVVVLGIGFFIFITVRGIPSYEAKDPGTKVTSSPERIANGKKMVTLLCSKCHLDPATGKLSGQLVADVPPIFGEIHSRNITNDKENGIGKWTDGQILYLLRTGIRIDGRFTPVYMPKFVHLSDEDISSVVAYLRSDDPWVQASSSPNVECKPSWMTKFLCFVAFKPIPYPEKAIPEPDKTNKLAFGKYLTTGKYECYQCHSKDFAKNDIINPEKSEGFFGGGNALLTREGKVIHSANITMDKETGIGNWTEDQFKNALKSGITPHGTTRYPMDPWTLLTDEETSAIFAYLKTVPEIKNKVNRELTE